MTSDADLKRFMDKTIALAKECGIDRYLVTIEVGDGEDLRSSEFGFGGPVELAIMAARSYGARREALEDEFGRQIKSGRAAARKR